MIRLSKVNFCVLTLLTVILLSMGCNFYSGENSQIINDPYSVSKAYFEKFEDLDALQSGRSIESLNVSPADIAASDKTVLVTALKNK